MTKKKRYPGRPPKYGKTMIRTSVFFPDEMHREMLRSCIRMGIRPAEYVRRAVEAYQQESASATG